MIIKFDNVQINEDYIMGLSQTATLFDGEFKLGSTLCCVLKMSVLREAVATQPEVVTMYDDENNLIFTLYVDEVNEENEDYYSYTLTDKMIDFNINYDWSSLEEPTVQNVLNAMCEDILGTTAPIVNYGGDILVTWGAETSAREFIGYVAELNGGFARISELNKLEFVTYSNSISAQIDVETCIDISLGELHKIDRVVLEMGVATHKYPADDIYTGDGETLYLNPNNILFTDNETYTIDNQLQSIYNSINGLTFYNFKTNRCQFDVSIQAGEMIGFSYFAYLNTNDGYEITTQNGEHIVITTQAIPVIAQVDWQYNGEWYGGFELQVHTKKQEETSVISGPDKAVKDIKITVDRNLGAITQRVSDDEGNISQLQQTASGLDGRFVSTTSNLATNITFDVNGVTIKTDNSTDTQLNLNNTGVYIKNQDGTEITTMTATQFTTGKWVMQQSGDTFNIFKDHN